MKWILILVVHVGPMVEGNSNAVTTQEFNTHQACTAAGEAAKRMMRGTVKSVEFACVSQG